MHKAQPSACRNALLTAPSSQRRARICEAIGRELGLEYFRRTNRKREARARMAIGLPPFPRKSIIWGRR